MYIFASNLQQDSAECRAKCEHYFQLSEADVIIGTANSEPFKLLLLDPLSQNSKA